MVKYYASSFFVSFDHVSLHILLSVAEVEKGNPGQCYSLHIPLKVNLSINMWGRGMAQLVKVLASKTDELNSILRPHVV